MDLPITLVIKAPNQRVEDQTVDCMLDWTVKKLKQHLTDVYPSKPREDHQRLIYSGKLLSDHLTLKDVLRQFEDGSNKHTVHLVCQLSPKAESRSREPGSTKKSWSHSRQNSSSSANSQQSVDSPPHTEGVRYRGHQPSSTIPQGMPSVNPNLFNNFSGQPQSMQSQFPAGLPADMAAMMYAGMTPDASGMAYSPEQYMWMQQMYAQYMAQYMQYYQQGTYTVPPNTPVTPTQDQNVPQQNGADNNPQAEEVAPAGNEDLDEEFQNRDWLDYVYTFSRLMVLLGIVYFYSNMTRFLMVAAFFVIVYAYQQGWLLLRNRRQPPQQQNQQQQQQQQQQNVQQDNIPQNVPGEPDQANPTVDEAVPPPPPQEPGLIQVSWTFVSTFFTSLFPSPPPAVNAN